MEKLTEREKSSYSPKIWNVVLWEQSIRYKTTLHLTGRVRKDFIEAVAFKLTQEAFNSQAHQKEEAITGGWFTQREEHV